MKSILATLFVCIALCTQAQDGITVCHTPALDKFNLFASNQDFNRNHPVPNDYVHVSAKGEMITFDTPDGNTAQGFHLAPDQPSNTYLFVIHEWWGLNEHIKREAEQLFNDLGNVHVLALDMYDGKVASTPDGAGKLMQGMDAERGKNIVLGALNLAGKDAKIGTIGWCFGGGWSLESTLIASDQAAACVIYYGMPVNDVSRLETLKAPVLGIFGSQDKWINPDVVKTFEENMSTANKSLSVEMYEADHAFANPSNPQFDKEATSDAYAKTLAFLKKWL
jgi:carboxymethylenebutenolidase